MHRSIGESIFRRIEITVRQRGWKEFYGQKGVGAKEEFLGIIEHARLEFDKVMDGLYADQRSIDYMSTCVVDILLALIEDAREKARIIKKDEEELYVADQRLEIDMDTVLIHPRDFLILYFHPDLYELRTNKDVGIFRVGGHCKMTFMNVSIVADSHAERLDFGAIIKKADDWWR